MALKWNSNWKLELEWESPQSLLPLQTDPVLATLSRTPKTHRPSSPSAAQGSKGSGGGSGLLQSIDVRALALVSFRDRVVLPLFPRLNARLGMYKDETEAQQARLQQMYACSSFVASLPFSSSHPHMLSIILSYSMLHAY